MYKRTELAGCGCADEGGVGNTMAIDEPVPNIAKWDYQYTG